MIIRKPEYYEQSCIWESDHFNTSAEFERINEVIKSIPIDTKTILDVGCGNGSLINKLADKFPGRFERIVGLDPSIEALKYVKSEKVNENINRIPFEANSFDLVSCLEVLEHLSQRDFVKGIQEIQRLSRKYILITVPNDEILEDALVLCPKCCCAFNPFYHVRNFCKVTLSNLFINYKPITIREIGPVNKQNLYHNLVYFLRLALLKPTPPASSICPQCGYQSKSKDLAIRNNKNKHSLYYIRLITLIKPFIFKQSEKKRWLLALYIRMNL
jgi:SAM-dependent methyltransferase